MTRLVFFYEPGSYVQGMIERRKRLRDQDVQTFCRYWLAGKDVSWIASQFETMGGKGLHWTAAYSHARRLAQQGILPAHAAREPVRQWGEGGRLLAATGARESGSGARPTGRPRKGDAAAMAGLPSQEGVVQRPGVPWEQQRAERIAAERAEAGIEPAESLTPEEKGEAQQAANRRRRRRADPAAT